MDTKEEIIHKFYFENVSFEKLMNDYDMEPHDLMVTIASYKKKSTWGIRYKRIADSMLWLNENMGLTINDFYDKINVYEVIRVACKQTLNKEDFEKLKNVSHAKIPEKLYGKIWNEYMGYDEDGNYTGDTHEFKEISEKYGLSRSTIAHIVNRISLKKMTEEKGEKTNGQHFR